jgi:hypothetical protein
LRCVLTRATPPQLENAFNTVLQEHFKGADVGLRKGCSGEVQSDLGGSHTMEDANLR